MTGQAESKKDKHQKGTTEKKTVNVQQRNQPRINLERMEKRKKKRATSCLSHVKDGTIREVWQQSSEWPRRQGRGREGRNANRTSKHKSKRESAPLPKQAGI